MPSPQRAAKARGTRFEREVAEFFDQSGVFPHPVNRAPRWGSKDKGDLVGTGQITFELKATKQINLAGFLTEAEDEAENAGTRFPVVVIKRRQKPVTQSYVVMSAEAFIELLSELPEHVLAGKEV
jgi:hypothetical protein